ncbi:MAG: flavin-containing monooxygenase [Sciscionella sp.]
MVASTASETVHTPIVIIGAGFAGLCLGIKLREAGIRDFVILDRGDAVGGTWRDNTYPGCAVDVASMLYSFSFEQNPRWSRLYCRREELYDYSQHIADKYQLRQHIRLNTDVTRFTFDEHADEWELLTDTSLRFRARFVLGGFGPLNRPSVPEIAGVERFTGVQFHSQEWDHGYDLRGKRVAVVGTGASAVQFVPQIAKRVAHLDLYQRSAAWLVPKFDRRIGPVEQRLFRMIPGLQKSLRLGMFLGHELLHVGQMHPQWLKGMAALSMAQLRHQVADPTLRAALRPDYTFSCKRPMVSSDFYPALTRDNVDLRTEKITEITPTGLRDATGTERAVDAIIWGTGFHVQDALAQLDVRGVGGLTLANRLRQRGGMEAYKATSIDGFPNLFTVLGPNGGLAHTSALLGIELQASYLARMMRLARERGLRRIEVTPEAVRRFTDHAHATLAGGVWSTGGCTSYFIDEHGVNRGAWPGAFASMRAAFRRIDEADFTLLGDADSPSAAPQRTRQPSAVR